MYLDYFGLLQPPCAPDADASFFHADAARRELLGALTYAARHGDGIVKLTGERGSGMTMLCRALGAQLAEHASVVHLEAEQLSPLGVVHATAIALGLNPDGKLSDEVMRMLQSHLEQTHADGRHAVLMVEQADTLPPETLEEIRQLTNLEAPQHKLLQVVLLGQPELNTMLRQPAMRQLRERITLSFVMPGIAAADVAELLAHRLRAAGRDGPDLFASDATRLMAGAAHGDLRRLMSLADKALKAAAAAQSQAVSADHVREAIKDKSATLRGRLLGRPAVAGALAALAVIGLGFAALAFRQATPAAKPAAKTTPAPAPQLAVAPQAVAAQATAVPAGDVPASAPGSALAEDSARPNPQPSLVPATTTAPVLAPVATPAAAMATPAATPVATALSAAPAVTAAAPKAAPATPSVAAASLTAPAASVKQTLTSSTAPLHPQATAASSQEAVANTSTSGLLQQSLRATKAWLREEPEDNYSIQIENFPAADAKRAEAFLEKVRDAIGLKDVHAYPMLVDGERRIAIVYGSFRSAQKALDTQALLTERWGTKPKMRNIKGIRAAIARAEAAKR
ncbi:ExeA family protein [Pseudoduganella namucuonensis]|uniref:Type II secretory pathway, component ExeA (Predicted ATPase) n=1 Tax=Pseudoduganella namucuonensis TaxID=1035707 RepID=A0A1I7L5U8_9BURK|nr:AAA family ATPase [Pseudoduganella namucuonensis]SFV05109.1 Type II secretory pathway, component ExeA (predicted ATPase) [Pseudoduganella namucuonensis]